VSHAPCFQARSWVRSSARQLLEQPTRANLGNLKGSTDGFTVQKHLCYKPVGNQQAAADFSGSLRQVGTWLQCTVAALIAWPRCSGLDEQCQMLENCLNAE
jgi:hypothetical protein